jgi:hypothetical protein
MKALLVLLLVLASAAALAQPGRERKHGPGPYGAPPPQRQLPAQRPLGPEEREQLRRDVREWQRDQGRPPARPMPPEERERLRRDIRDAYRR